jgi:hypothetical protein
MNGLRRARIKDTVDEDIFKMVKEREKWFELIVGSKHTKESKLFSEKVEKEARALIPVFINFFDNVIRIDMTIQLLNFPIC